MYYKILRSKNILKKRPIFIFPFGLKNFQIVVAWEFMNVCKKDLP